MSLWYVAIGYLVVCWLGSALIVVVFSGGSGDEDDDCPASGVFDSLQKRHPLRMRIGLAIAVLLLGPALPVIATWCGLSIWRDVRRWKQFARKHRQMLFESIHPANLPRAAQRHIEEHDVSLRELGFTPHGTYLAKPEPMAIHSKYYLAPDGVAVVDVSLIDGETAYSFSSVLENGHVLETACCESIAPTDTINESGRFTADMIERHSGEDDVAELHRRHRQTLRQLEREHRCGTLSFAADQIQAVMRYANDLFGQIRLELGELDDTPPEPVLPGGHVRWLSREADTSASQTVG